jgi:hypothetical protein
MRAGVYHIDKLDFLTVFLPARGESMTTNTLHNGFVATGLVSCDLERVLSKLNSYGCQPLLYFPRIYQTIMSLKHL